MVSRVDGGCRFCGDGAPALLGFGISTPDDVKAALKAGAAGAISGSHSTPVACELVPLRSTSK